LSETGELVVFRGLSLRAAILRLSGCATLLAILGGCGPELSKSDLGKVLPELPKVADADKPYPMPQLGPRPSEKPDSDSGDFE
jgi:hypothetical protein